MSLRKDEDRVEMADPDVHPLMLLRGYAGWIVSTTLTPDQFAALPNAHQALLGQGAARTPAVLLEARNADGDTVRTTYVVDRERIAELILELVGTFLDRDMFKQLVAALPEEWTR